MIVCEGLRLDALSRVDEQGRRPLKTASDLTRLAHRWRTRTCIYATRPLAYAFPWRTLAIAVIGGLSTATAFTLILIPVLYAGFVGMRDIKGEEAA